jgi:site-specific recombinase XerD
MATLRKLRGKYYIRIRMAGQKEKLIPTKTGDERTAKRRLKAVQEREFLIRAHLLAENELVPLSLAEAEKKYRSYCEHKGLRPQTLISYKKVLTNFKDVINPTFPVKGLGQKQVSSFIKYLKEKKIIIKDEKKPGPEVEKYLSNNTININLRSIQAFLNWLEKEKYILEAPKIELVKVDTPLPKFLTPAELDKIYSFTSDNKLLATFRVYEGLGLRLNELKHAKLEGSFVKVNAEDSKGRRDRIIPIPDDILEDFSTATTEPYLADYVSKAFTKLAKKAGIKRTLHSLRHTFALRTLVQTKDLNLVKVLMGHSQISTTMIYTKFPEDYLKTVLMDFKNTPDLKASA